MSKSNKEKRIRYVKSGSGVLKSMRNFTTRKGAEVRVELDTQNKKFIIVDAVEGTIVADGGNTVNLAVLKIKAKKALLKLGVKFDEEIRKRKELSAQ
jgi:hypothetical protein